MCSRLKATSVTLRERRDMDNMAPCALLLLLALVTCTSAQDNTFLGGHMIYYVKGTDDLNNNLVELHFRQTAQQGSCSLENKWICTKGDCAIPTSTDIKEVLSKDGICQTLGILTLPLPTNLPVEMQNSGCCWMPNIHSGTDWKMLTRLNLGIRSDTSAVNRPPVFTALPLYRLRASCFIRIQLLQHDRDGDWVKCRFANEDCRVCASHTDFRLLPDSCLVFYPGIAAVGRHVFEIVVEDFPRQPITLTYSDGSSSEVMPSEAISKQPLTFILDVEEEGPCPDDLELISPTPTAGEMLKAGVGEPLEFKIAAEASNPDLVSVLASGPSGMRLSPEGSGITAISWTPSERDADEHVPLCFSAERANSGLIDQTDMRCIIIEVGPKPESSDDKADGRSTVACLPTSMTITAELSLFAGFNGSTLSLINPACTATINETHMTVTTDLDSCGTKFEEDIDKVIFKNSISLVHDDGAVITRADDVEIKVSCTYPKEEIVSSLFKALRLSPVFEEDGFGKFSLQFEFFNSDTFEVKVDTSSKPLEVHLRQKIFMEITATAAQNAVLFVESCKATPEEDPKDDTFYSIIENGCIKDKTVEKFGNANLASRIGFESFRFIGENDEVYITCTVMLCLAGNAGTRCSQGCLDDQDDPDMRRKRSVAGESARHCVTQGPLRLKRSPDEKGTPAVAVNLDVPCLTILGVVALVCTLVAYKIKKSSTGYKQLPASDI